MLEKYGANAIAKSSRQTPGGKHATQKLTLRDSVVILKGHGSRDSLVVVIVEFLEGDGRWHLLEGATVARLESGAYEVAVAGLAEMWLASPDRFDGMRLRLDGREAKATGAVRRDDNLLVLRALVEAPRL